MIYNILPKAFDECLSQNKTPIVKFKVSKFTGNIRIRNKTDSRKL